MDRPNLSGELTAVLRGMIVDGRLAAGTRVNEVHLATRLGVSRTPLREALGRLAAEGALASSPRIGYFVRPLTVEELEEIYPIRAILDPEALRIGGIPTARRIARLGALNQTLRAATDAEHANSIDDVWHRELLADCPNKVLLGLIEQFMARTRRYEIAFMREHRHVRGAAEQHGRILAALRRRDLSGACDALRRNLQTGVAPIAEWLAERESKPISARK